MDKRRYLQPISYGPSLMVHVTHPIYSFYFVRIFYDEKTITYLNRRQPAQALLAG